MHGNYREYTTVEFTLLERMNIYLESMGLLKKRGEGELGKEKRWGEGEGGL